MTIGARLIGALLLTAIGMLTGCVSSPQQDGRVSQVPRPTYTPPPRITQPQISPELRVVRRPTENTQPALPPTPPTPVAQRRVQPLSGDWVVSDGHKWTHIIIHHSGLPRGNAATIDRHHRIANRWDELGYHFVINNGHGATDGLVEVGGRWPVQKHGAHVRVNPADDNYWNRFGIGICLIGNFNQTRPTRAQLESVARLVAYLQQEYNIPDNNIIGHGQVRGTNTDCPGRLFPYQEMINRAREIRQANLVMR